MKSRRLGPMLAVLMLVSIAVMQLVAHGASPQEGTLPAPKDDRPGVKSTLSYTGGPVGGALVMSTVEAPVCGTPQMPNSPSCDRYTLHVDLPADYWKKRAGKVEGSLVIDVRGNQSRLVDDTDIDLFLTDTTGKVIAKSHGADSNESITLHLPARGTYWIIVTGARGMVTEYRATVRLLLRKAKPVVVVPSSIRFAPPTVIDPTLSGAEPGVNADPSRRGTWYVDAPNYVPSLRGRYHRSTDGGETFELLEISECPERVDTDCNTLGGGDTETSIARDGTMYVSNQEVVNMSACTSFDAGTTFAADRCHAITAKEVYADRQWLAAYDRNIAYLAFSGARGTALASTRDGGLTWSDPRPVVPSGVSVRDGAISPLVVDATGGPNDGALFMLSRSDRPVLRVSRDGGATFTPWPSATDPKSGPPDTSTPMIAWLTIDRAGNLYNVWSDNETNAVMMSTMKAADPRNRGARLGSTWSAPVRVSIAPANSTTFAQVIAGDPGKITIAYQGSNVMVGPSVAPEGTPWYVYAGFSANALCQWDRSCPGGTPSFTQVRVADYPNHYGPICLNGAYCTSGRTLLDFFDLGVDPDGRVGVAWTDTVNGNNIATPMFAKVLHGPALIGRRQFRDRARSGLALDAAGDTFLAEVASERLGALDVTKSALRLTPREVRVTLGLRSADLVAALNAVGPGRRAKFVTRWSFGDHVYFLAAEGESLQAMSFYGGRLGRDDEIFIEAPRYPSGNNIYSTGEAIGYRREFDATGRVSGSSIEIAVPRSLIGSPRSGAVLRSVQTFSLVSLPAVATTYKTWPRTVDAAPPYTVRAS